MVTQVTVMQVTGSRIPGTGATFGKSQCCFALLVVASLGLVRQSGRPIRASALRVHGLLIIGVGQDRSQVFVTILQSAAAADSEAPKSAKISCTSCFRHK
jgi:hypothetical protein